MRKLFLFVFVSALSTMLLGQNLSKQAVNTGSAYHQKALVQDATPLANPQPYQKPVTPKATTEVEAIPMFSSVNVYGILYAEQTCMSYNADIDALMFAFRGHTGVVGSGNDICTAVSNDGGATFAAAVTASPNQGNNRYPSGTIYNPEGNTDPANAFKVVAAPVTDGTNWIGTNYATNNWANNGLYNELLGNVLGNDLMYSLTTTAGGYAHGVSVDYVVGGTDCLPYIYRGTFDAASNGFKWDSTLLTKPYYFTTSDNTYNFDTRPTIAFSPDGTVGYAMFIGSDNRADVTDLTSYQPIMYKTTDMGATWQKMGMLDLKNNPELIGQGLLPNGIWDRVWPLSRTWSAAEQIYKPWFSEADLVVDYNGNVHIMALCQGTFSDHPDSLGYTFAVDKGALFEIYNVNQGDEWYVRYIDTLDTQEVAAEESGYGAGTDAQGWDHRLQASRTANGKTVFAVWTDTDKEFFGEDINLYPDVRGWAHKVDEGLFTDVKDFTNQGATYGENYFMFVSSTAISHEDGTYEIPASKSDIRTNNDPGTAVFHAYLKGMMFEPTDFIYGVGVENINTLSGLNAYPNPVTSELTVVVNLEKAASLKIEMTNLLGQSTFAMNANGNAGTNNYKIDVANMQAGIYFYSVTVDGQKTTRKIVVK